MDGLKGMGFQLLLKFLDSAHTGFVDKFDTVLGANQVICHRYGTTII